MPTIELRQVAKHFGQVRALDSIELSIADGEQVAILGPSGSGKSTLLRVVAGLESLDSGQLVIDGINQRGIPAHRRDVAIVFQHFALYPHLSSLDNITLGLRHGLKLSRAEAERRARNIAERMQVGHLLSRKPKEMSGGQRQRIALARALARQSGAVLLDEPLSGLDAQLHAALRVEIASLLRSAGATSINVTHDQLDAMAMSDRVAVINHGKVEQLGTPADLYDRPATLFVARFIGSPPMNLVDLDDARSSGFAPGGVDAATVAVLGIRPEEMRLVPEPGDWTVSGQVALVEPSGGDRVVHVELIGTAARTVFAVRCRGTAVPGVGETVRIGAAPGHIHLFGTDERGTRLGTAGQGELPASRTGSDLVAAG